MSFHTRVKAGGWATHEKLTSSQQNQLDIDHADQRDWYFVRSISANYTLDTTWPDHVLLVDTGASGVNVTLTAAVANRVVRIKHVAGASFLGIVPNDTDTIEGLNATYKLTQIGSEITLVGKDDASGWTIIGRAENLVSQTFTTAGLTSSAWTAPAGCYSVLLDMCGGGGGGSSGTNGHTGTGSAASGGPGGGGAKRRVERVAVTPGTSYDVTIGAAGSGGSFSGAAGQDGGDTTFAIHASTTLATAKGGGGGTAPAAVSTGVAIAPGGTVATAAQSLGSSWSSTSTIAPSSAGGYATNGLSSVLSTAGSPSDDGWAGGALGTKGVDSGSNLGGGGGGGGGGGAYGVGAAGARGGDGASGVGLNGANGSSAAANTGAGGGGGGGAGEGGGGGGAAGLGGNGGTGQLTIWWRE